MKRILAFIFSVTSLLLAMFIYLDYDSLGFPDGHLTEFERALKILNPACILIMGVYAGYFFYIGYTGGKRKLFLKPIWTYISFVVVYLVMIAIHDYLALTLEHGTGG